MVVYVTQALPLSANSTASFALYHGGDAVSMDTQGNITVRGPTDIRFVFANAGNYQYEPIGISFQQTDFGRTDPIGTRNFQVRSVGRGAIVLNDSFQSESSFEYSIIFQRSDGSLSVIDPQIQNKGSNVPP